LTSTVYLLLALWAAKLFLRKRAREKHGDASFSPPVSLLKPLHGAEPNLESYIESFFRLDYPDYEILFCAREASDPGLLVAERVASRYPDRPVRILVSGPPPWPNSRCYSLEVMSRVARHSILAISDSDVSVDPNYLRDIVAPFADLRVGAATCLYRGVPERGPWGLLEALGMSVEMSSGVLVAEMLEGMKFTLGPTMVARKSALEEIGGFQSLGWYHADDFMLGNSIAARGHRVVLSHHAIRHHILNLSLRKSIAHQLGWMKSTRFSRPKGHFGTALTFAAPFGLLCAATGVWIGWPRAGLAILAWTIVSRMLQSALVGGLVVEDRRSILYAWLYPLRDFMGFCFWATSYFSSEVRWRDDVFKLEHRGRMRRAGKGSQGVA
jgi:ceramide glucosyltransferase